MENKRQNQSISQRQRNTKKTVFKSVVCVVASSIAYIQNMEFFFKIVFKVKLNQLY